MKALLEQLAATIADYRAGEIQAPDADHVGRWVAQFEEADREPLLRELSHVWNQVYASRSRIERFLADEIVDRTLAGPDPAAFWRNATLLDIQQNGNSQRDMLALLKPILRKQFGINPDERASGPDYVYLDDALFTGDRIKADLTRWVQQEAPIKSNMKIVLIATHAFGQWRLEEDLKAAAVTVRKQIAVVVKRKISFENRLAKRNASGVLWPVALVAGAEQYATGATAHVPRQPGAASKPFSSENGRQVLERAFTRAGLQIRSFCRNPSDRMKPLGYGPFGVGFGALFLTYRNCPNNAPLALWWGDPDRSKSHPFSKWRPLVPRKTYGGDDDV